MTVQHLTIGYGSIFPVTTPERMVAAMCMIFGGFLFGYIVGGLASTISARDAKRNRFYQRMRDLNDFMEEGKFPR